VESQSNCSDNIPFQWVTQSDVLSELCKGWSLRPALFIDTEFHREKTFYPQLALIQIYDQQTCYLIEPLAAEGNSSFKNLLAQSPVRKVFHSASEDCEVLFRFLNIKLEPLWDTQIAAAYAGLGNSIGYGRLVKQLCDIDLPKGHSRTNWMQRPLSDEQIRYALDDVLYLSQVYHHPKLQKEELSNWIAQECQALADRVEELDDIDRAYLDVKNAWTLNDSQLHRLYELARWREIKAREQDIPKTFIMRNEVLLELAQKGLIKNQYLPKINAWHPAARRRFSQDILALLSDIPPMPESLEMPLSPSFWNKLTEKMQRARAVIDRVGNLVGIDPDVLCSKKLLRGYVKYLLGKSPAVPRGWTHLKERHLGDPLRAIFCDNSSL
jgi:ribonuclease D